jgi:hypothetical protein
MHGPFDYKNWQEPTKTAICISLKHNDKCNRMNQQEGQKSEPKSGLFPVAFKGGLAILRRSYLIT